MSSRPFLVTLALLGVLLLGWLTWRETSSRRQVLEAPAVTVNKQPVEFTSHTFDPNAPPTDMPPLRLGESAECDSNFLANASVRGETRKTDDTHATVTVTRMKVTLQLKINLWVPSGAAQNLVEHEEGHRQISEYEYQTADKVAERIAATYIGKRFEIRGEDLDAESRKTLQQQATEVTDEYSKELNPGPAQWLYDNITDHAKNGVDAKGAVDHALKNIAIESAEPPTRPRN